MSNRRATNSVTSDDSNATGRTASKRFLAALLLATFLSSPEGAWPDVFVIAPATPIEARGTSPRSVAFGDFDGNGHLDFVIANANSSDVSLLLSDGTGGFAPAVGSPFAAFDPSDRPLPVDIDSEAVSVGDFNGDGHLDVITVNLLSFQDGGTASVWLGDGAGRLTALAPHVDGLGRWGAVSQFDGDRNDDLAGTTFRSEVAIQPGHGMNWFSNVATNQILDRVRAPFIATPEVTKDPDSNGHDSSLETTAISVSLNFGGGQLIVAPNSLSSIGHFTIGTAAAAYNEHRYADTAIANSHFSSIFVMLGNGNDVCAIMSPPVRTMHSVLLRLRQRVRDAVSLRRENLLEDHDV